MIWLTCGVGFAAFLFASGFFSGSETGIYCANRLRLRLRAHRGEPRALRLQRLLDDEQSALGVILVGTNVANYLTTVFVALLLTSRTALSDRGVEVYTTLIVAPVVFVFGEVLPKNLFQREADRLLYACSLGLAAAARLLAPVVWAIRKLSDRVVTALGGVETPSTAVDRRRRMVGLLREALADGDPEGRHGEFVERIADLSETPVRSVMVPLAQVSSLGSATDRASFLTAVRQSAHSRLPVVESGPAERGRVVGVVNVHALLADRSWTQVGERVEPVETLHPSQSVASAILQVKQSALPIAVVGRPAGRVEGIVTLKDLLEEIVGELDAW